MLFPYLSICNFSAGGAGGICDQYQMINSVMKSLNSGILTNLNYGKTVALKVTDITLAHEIGHNFGSQVCLSFHFVYTGE